MAISSTYYLDSGDLATATAVYLDLALTVLAPDGFYSDGTISREQYLGVLLSEENCNCGCVCYTVNYIGPPPIEFPSTGIVNFSYINCSGVPMIGTVGDGEIPNSVNVCSKGTIRITDGDRGCGGDNNSPCATVSISEVNCCGSLELSYRSDPGSDTYVASNLPNSSCELLAPDEPFYIFGTTCEVQNGNIACNTDDISDTFNGLNKYYKVYFIIV